MVSLNLVRLLNFRLRWPIPLYVGIEIILEISKGMDYIHNWRKMHLNLKTVNVLIEPIGVKYFRDERLYRVKLSLWRDIEDHNIQSTCLQCWDNYIFDSN